jgi:hypothetical protein
MPSYRACPSCACYVRCGDLACPFCATSLPPAHQHPAQPARPRSSRAMWLAYGAAFAAVGCTDSAGARGDATADATYRDDFPAEGEPAEARAETSVDAAAETSVDAAVETWVDGTFDGPDLDAREGPDADGATAAFDGAFVCIPAGIQGDAAIVCDARTQYCHLHSGNLTSPSSCLALDPTCLAYPPVADASTCPYLASSSCNGAPRCSCIAIEAYSLSGSCWSCSDDAGGLTLSCGPCYGAPPADLRRRPAARGRSVS